MKKMNKVLALLTAGALLFGCMFTSCSNGSSGNENAGNEAENGGEEEGKKLFYYGPEVEYTDEVTGEQKKGQTIVTYNLNDDGTYTADIEDKYSGSKRKNYTSGTYEIKGTSFIIRTESGSEISIIGENNTITHYADKTYSLTISGGGATVKYDFKTKSDGTFEAYLEGKTQKISFGTFYIDGSTLISKNQDAEIIAYTIGENDTLTMIDTPEEE
jgi:hypothetical protein